VDLAADDYPQFRRPEQAVIFHVPPGSLKQIMAGGSQTSKIGHSSTRDQGASTLNRKPQQLTHPL
jgi:hypothetical protein